MTGDLMDSQDWAPAEVVRAIKSLADEVRKIPEDVRSQINELRMELRQDYVRRDVWEARSHASDEWRTATGLKVADVDAGLERLNRAFDEYKTAAAENAGKYVTKDEQNKAKTLFLSALMAVAGVLTVAIALVGLYVK